MKYWYLHSDIPVIRGSNIYQQITSIIRERPESIEIEDSTGYFEKIITDKTYNYRELNCGYGVLFLVTLSHEMEDVSLFAICIVCVCFVSACL